MYIHYFKYVYIHDNCFNMIYVLVINKFSDELKKYRMFFYNKKFIFEHIKIIMNKLSFL